MKKIFLFVLILAAIVAASVGCKKDIAVKEVKLTPTVLSLEVGKTATLTATIVPSDATDQAISWSSSKIEVATVANGLVTAVAEGKATITVTTKEGGKTATCEVTVLQANTLPVLTTLAATGITNTTATLGGNITFAGNPEYSERGVCYSTSENPTTTDNKVVIAGSGIGEFTKEVSDLLKNTTYYVRAYAVNSLATVYGNEINFKTTDGTPENPATKTFTVNDVSFTMIRVEAGSFTMGAPDSDTEAPDWEKPAHQVTLTKDYYIGETEVTQALWEAVMGLKPTTAGPQWDATYGLGANKPAYNISWDDIQEFITKLNTLTGFTFRMPTEAEWEFAARGGKKSGGYKYSGSNDLNEVAWWRENSYNLGVGHQDYGTHDVKTKKANELGIYDMTGNVWEWCSDWWADTYNAGAQIDPQGAETGSYRVIRGAGWNNYARICRVSYRDYNAPEYRYDRFGFRLAAALP